jgi:hypothetical protein
MVVDRYARHDELPLRVVVGAATEEMACAAARDGFWLGPAKRPKAGCCWICSVGSDPGP